MAVKGTLVTVQRAAGIYRVEGIDPLGRYILRGMSGGADMLRFAKAVTPVR